MRKAPAIDAALDQAGFAKMGIAWRKAEALVVARDGNDSTILQHIDNAEIVDQIAIVKFAAL